MSTYQAGLKESDEKLQLLLEAAAARESIIRLPGETISIDSATIDSVLAGQEASFDRLERLLDPVWTEADDRPKE